MFGYQNKLRNGWINYTLDYKVLNGNGNAFKYELFYVVNVSLSLTVQYF